MTSTLPRDHRLLRLETLLRLRWYSIIAQTFLVLMGHFGIGLDLPFLSIAVILGLAVALNIALGARMPASHRVEESAAFVLLGADVVQLAALLYFTGGIQNPFSIFFLAPVLFSATALRPHLTILLGLLTMVASTFILPFNAPLRWVGGGEILLPGYFTWWLWGALQACILFVGVYAWRIAEEARQLVRALSIIELVLEREQHISALDGLAAAAAHELGTPLATIALVAGELLHGQIEDQALRDDILLIKEQTARCRQILAQIATLGETNAAPFPTVSVSGLVTEVAQRYKDRGAPVEIECDSPGPEPSCLRNPGLLYGIGNILQNATEFAASIVKVRIAWSENEVRIAISDDGPGIPAFVLDRLGDPYVTSRPIAAPQIEPDKRSARGGGMGLGLFIAKVLLERSGARLEVSNSRGAEGGATICLFWPRHLFENAERKTSDTENNQT